MFQALGLKVSEMPCLGLLEKPGLFWPESQTQVTVLPSAHALPCLLPVVPLWEPTSVPVVLYISLSAV